MNTRIRQPTTPPGGIEVPDGAPLQQTTAALDPGEAADGGGKSNPKPPDSLWRLLKAGPKWRKTCLADTAGIPSGYTYLAQLMGHDLGSSVPLDSVPYSADPGDRRTGAVRYNLIDNPLTLETIYGPGPSLAGHLFDPDTQLFRIWPSSRISRFFPPDQPGEPGIRALYDERNRDTLMLHELSAAWMLFHNLCANLIDPGHLTPGKTYARVRRHLVRVWHRIIRSDLLPRIVHPEIDRAGLQRCWELGETTLLHGLMRTFHSMPLSAYHLGDSGRHNLDQLMPAGHAQSVAEGSWTVDWADFFADAGPKTGISASIAPQMVVLVSSAHGSKGSVIDKDVLSARGAGALTLADARITAAIAALPAPWPAQLSATQLASSFAQGYPVAPAQPSAKDLNQSPIFFPMMIEAQVHGARGGLGPLGSALLKGSILAAIDRVTLTGAPTDETTLPHPATMLDLITTVREEV